MKKKKLPTQNQKMSCNSNVTRVLFLKCCLPKLKPKLNEQNDSIRTKSVSLLIDYFLITICIVLVPFKIFKNSCHLFLYILSLLSFVQFPLFNNRINVVYFFLNLQMQNKILIRIKSFCPVFTGGKFCRHAFEDLFIRTQLVMRW